MGSIVSGLLAALWNNININHIVNQAASSARGDEILGESSCPAWPVPHTDIRFQAVGSTARIHGYPSQLPYAACEPSFEDPGPPFLYLRGEILAYVEFIVGQNWRNALTTMDGQEGQVILRPALTDDGGESTSTQPWDEEQHCLRMRRCGAIIVSSETEIVLRETAFYITPRQPAERQVFGWPKKGECWCCELLLQAES